MGALKSFTYTRRAFYAAKKKLKKVKKINLKSIIPLRPYLKILFHQTKRKFLLGKKAKKNVKKKFMKNLVH